MRRYYALLVLAVVGCDGAAQTPRDRSALPACEGCGASEAPDGLTAVMTIAMADVPGTRLTVRGTVFRPDARTPAAGVLLYAYHTDDDGVYPTRGDERGNARRHGYLRGWLVTDSAGRYTIHTIRPGAYASRSEPAHIHVTLTPHGSREQWMQDIRFADDPLLPPEARAASGHAAAGVVTPVRVPGGRQEAARDFVLDSTGRREIGAYVRVADALADTLAVDVAASSLRWSGTKFWGRSAHSGIARLGPGTLILGDGRLARGTFTVDMRTIQVIDIPETDPVPRQGLTAHLRDKDFFWVERYPVAMLTIVSAAATSASSYDVSGVLTMRGVSRPIRFPTRVASHASGALRATARLVLDRQQWGVAYRGSRITNDLVDDEITIDVVLVATRATRGRRPA